MSRSANAPVDTIARALRRLRGARGLVAFVAWLVALMPVFAGIHFLANPHVWCEQHAAVEHVGGHDHSADAGHSRDDGAPTRDSERPHDDPCTIVALARLDTTTPSPCAITVRAPIETPESVVAPRPTIPDPAIPLLRLAPKTPPPSR